MRIRRTGAVAQWLSAVAERVMTAVAAAAEDTGAAVVAASPECSPSSLADTTALAAAAAPCAPAPSEAAAAVARNEMGQLARASLCLHLRLDLAVANCSFVVAAPAAEPGDAVPGDTLQDTVQLHVAAATRSQQSPCRHLVWTLPLVLAML